jgi:hypothetical protein
MLRIPNCLDNLLRDGGDLSTSRTDHALLPTNVFISVSGIHFCYGLITLQGLVWQEGLGNSIKLNIFIWSVSTPIRLLA